ncbi:argininosuccinate lyase [Ascosphaera pollenicola]|nr:argininosuccinate lyase [Ascosphaera pollenicola]
MSTTLTIHVRQAFLCVSGLLPFKIAKDAAVFSSPLPNPQLWSGPTIGRLQNPQSWANGRSWWHDPAILSSTGKGMDAEEPVAWKGWWNESALMVLSKVQLVRLSMEQKDALTVLLTGRSQIGFADVIGRIVKAKGLSFDMICLKPETGPYGQTFASTMMFKQALFDDIMLTYTDSDEIRVYEDRPRHVEQFRDYFRKFNQQNWGARKPISEKVIEVAELTTYLDPVAEAAEVQRMVNAHNIAVSGGTSTLKHRLRIKRTVFFTGYLIGNDDSARLAECILKPMLPSSQRDPADVKIMANSILITPRPAPKHILDKVGGIGKAVKWRITEVAVHENKLWAARVSPTNEQETVHSENPEPCIILAMRKNARAADVSKIRQWQAVASDDALVFESTVGHRTLLKVEEETTNKEARPGQTEIFKERKRRYHPDGDPDRPSEMQAYESGNRANNRPFRGGHNGDHSGPGHRGYHGGRGGAFRGGRHNQHGGRMPHNRYRGRGNHHHHAYKSLDDSKEQHHSAGDNKNYSMSGLDY